MQTQTKQSDEEKAQAKSNAPTSAGHHPEQPATPVSGATHPNQPASIDNVEPKIPARAAVPAPAVVPGTAPAPTKPGGPAARPVSPLIGQAQDLRDELEKLVNDNGEFDNLRDRHAALLAECQDTLSRSEFAAATGILDVCAGYLNRLAPRP